jgi:ABC-type antimicrobial peptide transport system permease subunit
VKYEGLQVATSPGFYEPLKQNFSNEMSLVMNTAGDPRALITEIREQVRAIDPTVPLARIKTMDQLMDESVAQPKFRTLLVGIFSGLALLLSAVGIYGVMAYSVTERTREIGIRMALGAQTRDVLRLVVRQGMSLTLFGVVLGVAGAFALTRVMSNLLFGVGTNDPTTFIGVSFFLILVSLAACYLPARRASKVNPVKALSHT